MMFLNIVIGLVIVWLLVLSFVLLSTVRHYRFLISRVKKGDLKSILETIIKQIEKQEQKITNLDEEIDSIEKKDLKHLQKIGFVRFNPFSDTGGDQSFCLSVLDAEDDGIVLSSLHGRGQTRIYAKAVKKGQGKELELSKEEEETIKRAKKGRL